MPRTFGFFGTSEHAEFKEKTQQNSKDKSPGKGYVKGEAVKIRAPCK